MKQLMQGCPWVVLFGAMGLLQAHGIAFWQAQLGHYGIGWSLLLEVVALWCWARPSIGSRWLGGVTSVLLLLGPLYQVATPHVEDVTFISAQREAQQKAQALLEADIEQQSAQLAAYTENAKHRAGWLPALQATETRLTASRAKLAELVRQTPGTVRRERSQALFIIVMECLGLVLFQLTAVLAVLQLTTSAPSGASRTAWFGLRPRPTAAPVRSDAQPPVVKPVRKRSSVKPRSTNRGKAGVSLVTVQGGKDV